ncbi:MAG: Xanthine and dehydrogenase maturation factor, XdhC/CoxF family, partial [Devosia sp.]|nr:Xanthine and dehydrogenase maturation factor, XdhC/CoxF family [Devosia sp.]
MVDLRRSSEAGLDGDNPADAFALLESGHRRGLSGVLITIIGVEGGAPRALGSNMAVLEDGTYCGYISGGCVEAAVASEALRVWRSGRDQVLRFGRNSPFMDVRLPCGGGIDLHMHVRPDPGIVAEALRCYGHRQAFSLELRPDAGTATLTLLSGDIPRTGWQDGGFRRVYTPNTKLVLVGRGLEFEALVRLGRAAALDVLCMTPDDRGRQLAASLGAPVVQLTSPAEAPQLPVDPWTAVVLLFHDHDWETTVLREALGSACFFIGALGSKKTHRARCQRLVESGVSELDIARIQGPIGLF